MKRPLGKLHQLPTDSPSPEGSAEWEEQDLNATSFLISDKGGNRSH